MRSRFTLWFIILITLVAIFVDLPKWGWGDKFPLKLGLDLKGGTEIELRAQMDKINPKDWDDAWDSAREVIERRVNLSGVSEAIVQKSKVGTDRRILVQLPGVDASKAAQLVGETAELDFREMPATISAQMIEATKSGVPSIAFAKPTGLTGADISKAQVTFSNGKSIRSGPEVSIDFTDEGAKKFGEITKRNVGKPLVIFLDNQPLDAPIVQQEILGGHAVITASFTAEQAKKLAIQLNAGALKAPLLSLSSRSIPPSLGLESLHKSLIGGAIGLTVVILYMAFYYGLLGILADVALLIYAILILAIFKTGGFILPPVTLTLAGVAGFILSVGMAVDANILIFERMKEELRWGKSKKQALELGFKRAWSSIWASNISSLLTSMILYYFGTSLVRGFAITLAIGVLVSMFSAIVVTRTILRYVIY